MYKACYVCLLVIQYHIITKTENKIDVMVHVMIASLPTRSVCSAR